MEQTQDILTKTAPAAPETPAEPEAVPEERPAAPDADTQTQEEQDHAAQDTQEDISGNEAVSDPELTRFVRRIAQQAEALRVLYPDLDRAFSDPEFIRLTSPDVGLDLRTAYEITRRRAVPAHARPAESGARSAAGAVPGLDPSRLSREDRAEIRRRVKAGDKTIAF